MTTPYTMTPYSMWGGKTKGTEQTVAPAVTPTVKSPLELKQEEIDKLTADFGNLKMYNSDPNANLREAMLQANEQMGTADQNVWAKQRGNLFAGLDTGFTNSQNDMMSALAKRGIANSGIAVKGFSDLNNAKMSGMAQADNQAFNQAVQAGDAYRQQRMANLTGYTQLGRGMSGSTQNYLGQAGGTYGGVAQNAGQTALGLGQLNNSYNSAKWNADAQNAAGKGSMTGSLVGAGATMFSDMALKKNVKQIGTVNGHRLVTWDWNEKGLEIAGDMPTIGVIAQEAAKVDPEAVTRHENGYLMVDYNRVFKGVGYGFIR